MRKARDKRFTVLVAGCDEYTKRLIADHVAGARILDAPNGSRPHLAVVEASDHEAVDAVRRARPAAVIALTDAPERELPFPGRVLARPYLPAALFDAIDDELQQPVKDRPRPTILAALRLGLFALGAGARGLGDGNIQDLLLIAGSLAYFLIRLFVGRRDRPARIADLGVASVLVGATGGSDSAFVPLAVLASVACGMEWGPRAGAFAGGVLSVAAGARAFEATLNGSTSAMSIISLLALFPLAGLVGGIGRRLRTPTRSAFLAETNRLLLRLHHIAREVPGGMDAGTVAEATVDEMRTLGVPAAAILIREDNQWRIRASYGIDAMRVDPPPLLQEAKTARVVHVDDYPQLQAALGGHRRWIVAPAVRGTRRHGILLAALGPTAGQTPPVEIVGQLAADAAIAFENAELLRRVRALATGEERRRIAGRVHDGLAQTLTHLRLEMDFIARHETRGRRIREQLERMSDVLDRAVGDVHGLMHELKQEPSEPPDLPVDGRAISGAGKEQRTA